MLVAVGGERRKIPNNYELADFAYEADYGDIGTGAMFNQLTNKRSYDLFVYLGQEYNLNDENSITDMVNWFWNERLIGVGAIYTDISICHKGTYICTKFNPSYSSTLYDEKCVLNIPLMVKSAVLPVFNTNIKYLSLWDGILNLMKNTLLFHMPEVMFSVNNAMESPNVTGDIKIINDTYYKS